MGRFREEPQAQKPESQPKDQTCTAFGCPLAGSVSQSTNGGDNFFCRYHIGSESGEWGAITMRVKRCMNEFSQIDQMLKLNPYSEDIDKLRKKLFLFIRDGAEFKIEEKKETISTVKTLVNRLPVPSKTESIQAAT